MPLYGEHTHDTLRTPKASKIFVASVCDQKLTMEDEIADIRHLNPLSAPLSAFRLPIE